MRISLLKSKIHRVTVTESNLNYTGSIEIDEELMLAADIIEYEKVQVLNINNGERFDTYVIKGGRNSQVICLNGPAARKGEIGDILIIVSYGLFEKEEAKTYKPIVVYPDTQSNKLRNIQ